MFGCVSYADIFGDKAVDEVVRFDDPADFEVILAFLDFLMSQVETIIILKLNKDII